MTRDGYMALLQRALASPYGVAVEFGDFYKAERARRRIYSLRDALRRAGDDSYDILSLVMRPHGKLLIVRRDKLPRRDIEDGLSMKCHLISADELPDKFGYCNYSFAISKPK